MKIVGFALTFLASGAMAADVVEFRNDLDFGAELRFFITADPGEQVFVDSGAVGHWVRTGNTFKSGGNAQVCRFYGSMSPGPNSHFYTADSGECAYLRQLQASTPATQKRWNCESLDFLTTLPVSSACAAGTTPVYRAYNNGFARGVNSNHRITTNQAGIQQVVDRGWVSEGIVMCGATASLQQVPIPVQRTSYLNFKNNGQGQTALPEYTHAMAYGDFFQDGTISLMMSPVRGNPAIPSDINKTGTVYFYKKINGAWVDKTSDILRDNTGCVWPREAVSADFNGDGKPDIFLAYHGFDAPPFAGEKQVVFLSQPDGVYKRSMLNFVCFCHGAAAADLRGDGFADVVIADTSGDFKQLMYLRNNKDGTFTPSKTELSSIVGAYSFPFQTTTFARGIITIEFIGRNGSEIPDLYLAGDDLDFLGRAEGDDPFDLRAWTPKIFVNRNGAFNADFIPLPIDNTTGLQGSLDLIIEGNILWTLKVDYSNPVFKVQQFDLSTNMELAPSFVPNNGIFWIIRDPVKGIVTAGQLCRARLTAVHICPRPSC